MAKASRQDRAEMEAALEERTAHGYKTRDNDRTFFGCFKRDVNFPQWFAEKGEHEIDVIPYWTGKTDPKHKEGDYTYVLNYLAHRNVGPRKLMFQCLEQFNKGCPICQHRDALIKEAPEGERQRKEHDDMVKALKASRRCLYNIIVYDNSEQEDKGIQIWEMSHFLSEKRIQERAKRPKKRGGGLITYASTDPDKGHTITFERTGEGFGTKYENYDLHPRDYEIDQGLQDDVIALDELLYIPGYAEVKEAFWDEGDAEDEEREEGTQRGSRRQRDAEEDEEDPPPRRRKTRTRAAEEGEEGEGEEEPPRKHKCPVPGGVFGKDTDEFTECEKCPLWNPCAKASIGKGAKEEEEEEEPPPRTRKPHRAEVEDDEEPPRRGKRIQVKGYGDDGEEEPPPRKRKPTRVTADDDGEEDPPPRRRARAKEDEEEEPPPRRGSATRPAKASDDDGEEDPPPRRTRKARKIVDDDGEEEDDIPF